MAIERSRRTRSARGGWVENSERMPPLPASGFTMNRLAVAGSACEGVQERFYAISVERRLRHPAVVAITEEARAELFSGRR